MTLDELETHISTITYTGAILLEAMIEEWEIAVEGMEHIRLSPSQVGLKHALAEVEILQHRLSILVDAVDEGHRRLARVRDAKKDLQAEIPGF